MIKRFFNWKRKSSPSQRGKNYQIKASYFESSITIQVQEAPQTGDFTEESLLFLQQLEDEGFASKTESEIYTIQWNDFYTLCQSDEFLDSLKLLPVEKPSDWGLYITEVETLTDPTFSVTVQKWISPNGEEINPRNITRQGGHIQFNPQFNNQTTSHAIIPAALWQTLTAIENLQNSDERTSEQNIRHWGTIRQYATQAKVAVSHYLQSSIVLTPENLQLKLHRSPLDGSPVITVEPTFNQAPENWLKTFDKHTEVKEHYKISEGNGVVNILPSEEVRSVLKEIKSMTARRLAGKRAHLFIQNPYAILGKDANKVLNEKQFENIRDESGIGSCRFSIETKYPDAENQKNDKPKVILNIEETFSTSSLTHCYPLDQSSLSDLIRTIENSIHNEFNLFTWEEFEVEIDPETDEKLKQLKDLQEILSMPDIISWESIANLENYGDRIMGIGREEQYHSPFIVKKDEESAWVPENLVSGFVFDDEQGNPVSIPLPANKFQSFKEAITLAEQKGEESFNFPGCPKPIPTAWAKNVAGALDAGMKDKQRIANDQTTNQNRNKKDDIRLILKSNINTLDYEETRRRIQSPPEEKSLPQSLLPDFTLKAHQIAGYNWLAHMWHNSPQACSGVLLADDMGLGKTIQILTLLAHLLEDAAHAPIDPFLIIAPVSLLENWKIEIEKFFRAGTFNVLTLHGSELRNREQPIEHIRDLAETQKPPKLLMPDWRGAANVVIINYATLRNLEFSLAAQPWSVIICDEAQAIKNPNTIVTRAAKKMNAQFKIACTGTPVENTLTDLWCLFDFIQPGLLKSLKEFGRKYKRPADAKTEEQRQQTESLRAIIAPQLLRRTKKDIAYDLPEKIIEQDCLSIPISDYQRNLYSTAIGLYENNQGEAGSMLKLLHQLRHICSSAALPPGSLDSNLSTKTIRTKLPKIDWLIGRLQIIKRRNEKAIVFCEFKNLQRTIQTVLSNHFNIPVDIVNGDTSTAIHSKDNRARKIEKFQNKNGFNIIVLSPLAVGCGLNIQTANHVFHFTRHWNPAKEDQATDRAYRIGQEKDVHVYYLVITAEDFITFDEKMNSLIQSKRELAGDILNGTGGEIKPEDFGMPQNTSGNPVINNRPVNLQDIQNLTPVQFEHFCALLWRKQGYSTTEVTSTTGDGGVDIVAIKKQEPQGVLIQCKTSSNTQPLGWQAIRDVTAGHNAYQTRYPEHGFQLIAITNQTFNQNAKNQAQLNDVQVYEKESLLALAENQGITLHDMVKLP